MHPFYHLLGPIEGPQTPKYWSYSSLKAWRSCPRRWWLLRARYPNIREGYYPVRFGPAALQGRVVHRALEVFATHVQQQTSINSDSSHATLQTARQSFHVRKVMRRSLAEVIAAESDDNPRINIGLLKAKISLDRCVNFFKRAVLSDFPDTVRGGRGSEDRGFASPGTTEIPEGPEVWVRVENPPMHGRIDMVASGGIIDFKTGEPDPCDKDQMYFYALLWWLKTGRPPTSLKIVYMNMTACVRIEVPSIPMLEDLLERLRCDMSAMHDGLASGIVEARPDEQRCRLCPVRQHCDVFWSSPQTEGLRAGHLKRLEEHVQVESHLTDVSLNSFPADWEVGKACVGLARSPELGPLFLTIDHHRCPEAGESKPHGARILGARVRRSSRGWYVTMARQTEVFWTGPLRGGDSSHPWQVAP